MLKFITRQLFTTVASIVLAQTTPYLYADSAHLILSTTTGQPVVDHIYLPPSDTISASVEWDNGVPFHIVILLDQLSGSNLSLRNFLNFDTSELGTAIQPGTYLDAQRWPFEAVGHPGFALAHGSSLPNTLTGSFNINQLAYFTPVGGNGFSQLQSFSATFTQFGDNNPVGITGSITFESTIPEPTTATLLLLGMMGCGWRRR